MTTVYTLDLRLNKRVLVDAVVHYAGQEAFLPGDGTPGRPWATRCGVGIGDRKLNYLGDDEHVVVTCVACLGDRRRER